MKLKPLILICSLTLCLPSVWAQSPTETAHQLFEAYWKGFLAWDPLEASAWGMKAYDDRWPDRSPQFVANWLAEQKDMLAKAKALDMTQLKPNDQLNLRLLMAQLEYEIEDLERMSYLIMLNQRGGIQLANQWLTSLEFKAPSDYESWLKRLEGFSDYMDQTLANLKLGITHNVMHPKVIVGRVLEQVRSQIIEDPTQSSFYQPFTEKPSFYEASAWNQISAKARDAVKNGVIPAMQRLRDFFESQYMPAAYEKVGIWQQKDGKQRYAFLAKKFTTTDMTPQQIHDTGKREVARIRAEMLKIIEEVGFEGDFKAFLEHLRTNPKFYYKDGETLLAAYRALSKQIDPTLVKLFHTLPRTPYGVDPIPDDSAPYTTTAYYVPPAADGSRAGIYAVNLYKPEARPIYEMEALSLHEAVPGHHFQIALAMELGQQPNFRRYVLGFTAYVEGWALYAESLGPDLGFYRDPYSKFGQLTYEMWRAIRLVVDTGIHYLGWSREDSIDFFAQNAAKSKLDIINEIDRYIAWPGQALGYKIGELKIKELRKHAEKTLGNSFDIREFHHQILNMGAIPLNILENHIQQWVQANAQTTP